MTNTNHTAIFKGIVSSVNTYTFGLNKEQHITVTSFEGGFDFVYEGNADLMCGDLVEFTVHGKCGHCEVLNVKRIEEEEKSEANF